MFVYEIAVFCGLVRYVGWSGVVWGCMLRAESSAPTLLAVRVCASQIRWFVVGLQFEIRESPICQISASYHINMTDICRLVISCSDILHSREMTYLRVAREGSV